MYLKLFKLSMLLALVVPCASQKQAIVVKEVAEPTKDYLHEFFRPTPDVYLTFNYAAPHSAFSYNRNYNNAFVVGYDGKLNELFNVPLKELSGNKYQGGLEINNRLYIFFTDGKKVFWREVDGKSGKVMGTSTQIMTVKAAPQKFFKGYSRDSAYCYVLFDTDKGAISQYEGVIMDRGLNVVTNFAFTIRILDSHVDDRTFVLSEEGLFFAIHGVRVKSKEKPIQYLISEVNKEGKSVTSYIEDLPEGSFANIIWKPAKNGLGFTGLFAKTKKEGFKYILTGNFNSWLKKLSGLKEFDFTGSPYWQSISDKYLKSVKTDGIPTEVRTKNSFINADGSSIMVMQELEIIDTYRGNYSYTDSRTSSMYVIKFKPDGTFEWLQFVPCNQKEPTYPIFTGMIALQRKNRDIVIVYHDNEKNSMRKPGDEVAGITIGGSRNSALQLTAVVIKDDGGMVRTAIGKNLDPDHRLAPYKPFAVYDDEILFTSYNLRNLGKSTFKLGVIRLP